MRVRRVTLRDNDMFCEHCAVAVDLICQLCAEDPRLVPDVYLSPSPNAPQRGMNILHSIPAQRPSAV